MQVTGRFVKLGKFKKLDDILAFPDLSSSARSPDFHFKMTVNRGKQTSFFLRECSTPPTSGILMASYYIVAVVVSTSGQNINSRNVL